jgi:hypothetical protein
MSPTNVAPLLAECDIFCDFSPQRLGDAEEEWETWEWERGRIADWGLLIAD